jgi:trehalose-6-phosphate synthase
MYAGLTMEPEQRRRMNEAARDVVRANDIARWISNQVQDIRDLVAPGRPALHLPASDTPDRRRS